MRMGNIESSKREAKLKAANKEKTKGPKKKKEVASTFEHEETDEE
jgi:hypothetical protein